MKHLTLLALLLCLMACNNKEESTNTPVTTTTTTPAEAATTTAADTDKAEIEQLVKSMYRWVDTTRFENAFYTFEKDSIVVGLDTKRYAISLKHLEESGFFAPEFANNLTAILKTQDSLLRNHTVEWAVGDISPFSNDASPWCDCQDEPTDKNPYEQITLHFDELNPTQARFYWNWQGFGSSPEKHHYHMRTVKQAGKWKIAWMEGWDYKANTTY